MRLPPTVLAVAGLALLPLACGDEPGSTSQPPTAATTTSSPTATEAPPAGGDEAPEPKPERDEGGKPQQPGAAAKADAAAGAERAYTDYIAAIDARDGEALCALLPPGAERELEPPVERGGCGASLGASIGYEDPRGYPIWAGTTLNAIQRLAIGSDQSTVRLTAMIVTDFEGREPSVESDIAYLERVGGDWRLAQPTAALYRAIGNPEPPPTVIAPPG